MESQKMCNCLSMKISYQKIDLFIYEVLDMTFFKAFRILDLSD